MVPLLIPGGWFGLLFLILGVFVIVASFYILYKLAQGFEAFADGWRKS